MSFIFWSAGLPLAAGGLQNSCRRLPEASRATVIGGQGNSSFEVLFGAVKLITNGYIRSMCCWGLVLDLSNGFGSALALF